MPLALKLARVFLKLTIGIILLTFFLNYQPSFASFPNLKKAVVFARDEQSQKLQSQALPLTFQLPHDGYVSNPFSSYHPGVDIATGLGTPVKTIASGVVSATGFNFFGYGLFVEIDHGYGFKSFYAHLARLFVHQGQHVSESSHLGEVGMTGNTSGPHTHLEILKDKQRIDPLTILPQFRRFPTKQGFQSQNPNLSQLKGYIGGPIKLPTLGTSQAKVVSQPKSTPTPAAKVNDGLNIQALLSPSPSPKLLSF